MAADKELTSRVFLPLRSNAGWFTTADTQRQLDRRLKHLALIYDELLVQDGRYNCVIHAENVLDHFLPAAQIKGDRAQIRYYKPGDTFGFGVSDRPDGPFHPLMKGPTLASFEVDFYPVLKEAGLLGEAYITLFDQDITREGQDQARARATPALRRVTDLGVPGGFYAQRQVVQSLYIDGVIAEAVGAAMSLDERARPLILEENAAVESEWHPEARALVANTWLDLGFPDFSALPWDKIQEIRESAAGRDFRRLLSRVAHLVETAFNEDVRGEEIRALSRRELVAEHTAAMARFLPSARSVTLNVLLNLWNYGGVVSTGADVIDLVRHRRSWVTLLRDFTD